MEDKTMKEMAQSLGDALAANSRLHLDVEAITASRDEERQGRIKAERAMVIYKSRADEFEGRVKELENQLSQVRQAITGEVDTTQWVRDFMGVRS